MTSLLRRLRAALANAEPDQGPTGPTIIGSVVGGGPMARLADALTREGRPTVVHAAMSPEAWRARMGAGRSGRIGARLRAFLGYPLELAAVTTAAMPEVVVPTTNPFILPMVLIATRPLHGRAVVPLVYDLYPDALEAAGVGANGPLRALAELANRWWFPQADGVVFIGHRMADHARARYGEPSRWTVIETGADTQELDPEILTGAPESELERWCDERFVLTYAGNMGLVHDVDTLAAALPELLAASVAGPKPIGLVIAGTGPGIEVLREALSRFGPDTVRFEAPLADRAWARLLARSEVSLVTLREEARHTCIPSKALSAIAARSALLAVAPRESDLGDLIAEHHCGVRITPGDAKGVVRTVRRWVEDPESLEPLRENARNAAVAHFDVAVLAKRWEALLTAARPGEHAGPIYDLLKRGMDIAAASAALVATGPLLLGGMVAVRLNMGSPVFFRQKRPGIRGTVLELVKFRTMRHPKPHEVGPEFDGARLTRVGRFLRSTSIDELPTLINVLTGDMSLVGPRPLLVRYLERYSPTQARRHEVAPGVTGWAQVNGRNTISWEEKFERDVWYVENRSLALDLRILVQTVLKVVRRADINQSENTTMPEFMGSGAPAAPADGPELAEVG